MQRLAWAVDDAERAERAQKGSPRTATLPGGHSAAPSRAGQMAGTGMSMGPVG